MDTSPGSDSVLLVQSLPTSEPLCLDKDSLLAWTSRKRWHRREQHSGFIGSRESDNELATLYENISPKANETTALHEGLEAEAFVCDFPATGGSTVVESGPANPVEESWDVEEPEIGSESSVLGSSPTPLWSLSYLHDGDDTYTTPDGGGKLDIMIVVMVRGVPVIYAAVSPFTRG